MTNDTPSRHVRSLLDAPAQHRSELGSITRLTADDFPLLRGLSIKRLVLAPGSIREPHWHANADEIGYCLAGDVLVSILDNADVFSSFTISAGQMFTIGSGSLHHIENIGDGEAEIVVAFSHERPEDFSLHAAFGTMTDAVLGNTYDLESSAFAPLTRDTGSADIVARSGPAVVPDTAGFGNPHKFDVEGQNPPLSYPFAHVKLARSQFWPALENLSMYSLTIEEEGMREPHWHPRTAEMGYVHKGRARMSVLDPDGTVDTYLLGPGDVYFIPKAYPHRIEVVGDDEIHFLIFFDQPTPGDIGYRASVSAFSRPVLAATFGVTVDELPEFPFTPIDPLLVARRNPVDPVG
ncbi:cupin domain-containing protein [Herbiconiux sp. KACC 21604]|uniref:cupin domain-containing protein n=1 Tax=unclassified Herbiconiux TaxID=2618217 RepID=UPI00149190F7|nr:cupin domain-containing protein [Herbiconiux sp. SALV-R1]QJU54880.1 cupin domain-containing protein [Herbiconiux sp. SALV-R1]WPO86003.1 cupin domain-containing protein [Herbiconiux sp. KACC 21604]